MEGREGKGEKGREGEREGAEPKAPGEAVGSAVCP